MHHVGVNDRTYDFWEKLIYTFLMDDNKHPPPMLIEKVRAYYPEPNFIFGFSNPKDLVKWFDNKKLIKGLQKLGFVVRLYESDDVVILKRQLSFNKDNAVLVETINLMSFYLKNKSS